MSLRRLLSSEIASIVRSGRTLLPRFEEIPPALASGSPARHRLFTTPADL